MYMYVWVGCAIFHMEKVEFIKLPLSTCYIPCRTFQRLENIRNVCLDTAAGD